MSLLPTGVATSYSPLNGLIKPPPGAGPRSSGTPTAPGAGNPTQNSFTPATSTAATPAGVTIGGSPGTPASTPDWKALMNSDPGLLQAEADLGASGISNAADRNAAFQRNIIDYGQLPDLNSAALALGLSQSDLQGILGDKTGQLAQENTQAGTSILARLNADNQKTIQSIKNTLAARGLYRSGETGYQLGQQNQNYTNSQYGANKSLLESLANAQGQYVNSEQQRQIALAQAASDAANRAYQNYQGSPGTPATAGVTASYVGPDTHGNYVYQTPDGSLYGGDGNPYSGPASQGPIGLAPQQSVSYQQQNIRRYGI